MQLSSPARPPITLLGLEGCPGAADLRAYLGDLGVPFADVAMGPSGSPGDDCGYVSPSVQRTRCRVSCTRTPARGTASCGEQ